MGICSVPLWTERDPSEVHGTFVYYYGRYLVINEQYGDHEANVAQWGQPTASYPATTADNNWAHPWTDRQTYRKIYIGSEIKPGSMENWFAEQPDLTEIIGLEKIDTSECTSLALLFYRDTSLTEIVGANNWDTSNVTDMRSLFHGAYYISNIQDLLNNKWNTSNVTDFSGLLSGVKSIVNLVVGWDMRKAEFARSTISYMTELETIDLSGVSVPLLQDAPFMFGVNDKLTTIYSDGTFVLPPDCTAANMFRNNYLLVGGSGTTYIGPDAEYARIDNPPSAPGYFTQV